MHKLNRILNLILPLFDLLDHLLGTICLLNLNFDKLFMDFLGKVTTFTKMCLH